MASTAAAMKAVAGRGLVVQRTKPAAGIAAGRRAPSVRCSAQGDESKKTTGGRGLAMKAGTLAVSAALAGLVGSPLSAFAVDEAVLQEKGRNFAESTAQVLRTVDQGAFKDALKAAVEVALSVDPEMALDAVDAALECVENADTNALKGAVVALEHATTIASNEHVLVPPDSEIDSVVDAIAKVGGSIPNAKVTQFAQKATKAALSADKSKLAGLTFAGGKIALSADKGALANATKAAGDLVLSVGG